MFLKNRSLDEDKSFQKTVKVRTWFCLPCTQRLTLDMKKTVKKVKLHILQVGHCKEGDILSFKHWNVRGDIKNKKKDTDLIQ